MSEFLFNVRLFVIPPTLPRRKNFRYAVGPVKQGHLYLLSTLSYLLNDAIEARNK